MVVAEEAIRYLVAQQEEAVAEVEVEDSTSPEVDLKLKDRNS